MTRERRRQDELRTAWLVQGHCPELTGFALANGDPPEPDVVAQGPSKLIGVEITDIRGNPRLAQRESEEARIAESAGRLVLERTGIRTAAYVNWSKGFLFEKRNRAALACALADIAIRSLPAPGECISLGSMHDDNGLTGNPAFDHIDLVRLDDEEDPFWTCPQSWQGADVGPEFVQGHVARKNGKRCEYKVRYDECWLVLVRHGDAGSSGFGLSPAVFAAAYSTEYDRVLLYSRTAPHLRELRISGRNAGSRAV